jgi:hypothetical protein
MIYPRAPGPAADSRALELDVEVALRVDGFRWVRWREGETPDPPRESGGRFLARRDDPLGHLQVPALASVPLAAQPYRHLPRYSLDAALALEACDRVGLFQEGAMLRREPGGAWALELPGAGAQADRSLPRLLARAALVWRGHCRQELQ